MLVRGSKSVWIAAALLAAGVALAGCRDEEQGRPVTLEKGQYPEELPTGLSQEQIDQLNDRTRHQSMN